jgi:Uma2 family endonuclease
MLAKKASLYHGRKVTFDEYQKLKNDDFQYEIVEGVMRMMAPAPFYEHQSIVLKISARLYFYVEKNDTGIVSIAPRDVKLAEGIVYQPDILFISKERLPINTRKYVDGPPDFVVEVLSAGTLSRDIREKFFHYEKYGVKEYWIINPDDVVSSEFYFLVNGRYKQFYPENNIVQSKVIEKFEIHLDSLS